MANSVTSCRFRFNSISCGLTRGERASAGETGVVFSILGTLGLGVMEVEGCGWNAVFKKETKILHISARLMHQLVTHYIGRISLHNIREAVLKGMRRSSVAKHKDSSLNIRILTARKKK